MVEDFRTANPDWMVVFGNITYGNIVVTKEGQIKLTSLEDVMIVDKAEINQSKLDWKILIGQSRLRGGTLATLP